MQVQQLIEDDLNKRSAQNANKSTLVAGGADTQLVSSCVSAPLATNMNLWNPIARYKAHTSNVGREKCFMCTQKVNQELCRFEHVP